MEQSVGGWMSADLLHDWRFVVAVIAVVISVIVAAARFWRWQGRVDTKLEGIDALNETVAGMAKRFEDKFNDIFLRLPAPQTATADSPLRLTEFGRKISADLDMPQWLDMHQSRVLGITRGMEEFEVFEECVAYVRELEDSDDDFRRRMAATAYNFGTETDQIRRIYQIELRDRLLETRDLDPTLGGKD